MNSRQLIKQSMEAAASLPTYQQNQILEKSEGIDLFTVAAAPIDGGKPATQESLKQQQPHSEAYLRLKKKYKALKQEYVRVIQSWEDTHKQVKVLSKERSFLREKLESFLKMQIP